MIFHIPLRDLKLFSAADLDGLPEAELVQIGPLKPWRINKGKAPL